MLPKKRKRNGAISTWVSIGPSCLELVPNRGPLKLLQSRDLDHVQYIKHSELASNTNTNVMFHTIFTLNRRMKVLLDMIFFSYAYKPF